MGCQMLRASDGSGGESGKGESRLIAGSPEPVIPLKMRRLSFGFGPGCLVGRVHTETSKLCSRLMPRAIENHLTSTSHVTVGAAMASDRPIVTAQIVD